jgi:hypothetical protein
MTVKRKRGRSKKPPGDLPSRWFRSKSGRGYAYIVETKETNAKGEKCYKLQSLMHDFVDDRTGKVRHLPPSSKLWTREDIEEAGRFLKNPPTKAMIERAKKIPL